MIDVPREEEDLLERFFKQFSIVFIAALLLAVILVFLLPKHIFNNEVPQISDDSSGKIESIESSEKVLFEEWQARIPNSWLMRGDTGFITLDPSQSNALHNKTNTAYVVVTVEENFTQYGNNLTDAKLGIQDLFFPNATAIDEAQHLRNGIELEEVIYKDIEQGVQAIFRELYALDGSTLISLHGWATENNYDTNSEEFDLIFGSFQKGDSL